MGDWDQVPHSVLCECTSKSGCRSIVTPCRRREVLFDVDVQQFMVSATGLDIETNMRLEQA